jgi:hypothetical protein
VVPGRDTSASRVRRQRSVTSKVDLLEREYMEAAAAAAADAVVVDSVTVKLELQRAQAAALPTHRATGQLHGHRPPVLVLPLPATALATRWAHAGGRLHQQCRKEHRCVAAILSFWSVPSHASLLRRNPHRPDLVPPRPAQTYGVAQCGAISQSSARWRLGDSLAPQRSGAELS